MSNFLVTLFLHLLLERSAEIVSIVTGDKFLVNFAGEVFFPDFVIYGMNENF